MTPPEMVGFFCYLALVSGFMTFGHSEVGCKNKGVSTICHCINMGYADA